MSESAADSFIGTRQAGNLLTKASWWCGGIFLLLAFVLQIASTRSRVPASVLDKPLTNVPIAPVAPTQKSNPAVPLEAAPKTPAQTAPPTTPAPAPKGTQPKQ